MRFVLPMLFCLPVLATAAEICPWLNVATAGGVFGGPVTGHTVKKTGDTGSCVFTRQDGARVQELRIEVSPAASPARCRSAAVPLKAIGNEAQACTGDQDGQLAEQVIGRVRDHAFVVRLATTDRAAQPADLRAKARKLAEQVAGILF